MWLTVFLDLLYLSLLTVSFDAFVVWKIYEDALTEQRTGVAGVVASTLQGALASLPVEVLEDPGRVRQRVRGILQPFETRDLGLESAIVYNRQGDVVLAVGVAPAVLPLEEDEDLESALVNRTEVLSLGRRDRGSFDATVLQITVPVTLQTGERWAARVRMPLQEGQGVFTRLQRAVLGLLAANALLLGVLGYLLVTRRMVRPIERLAEAVRRVGQGELDSRVPEDREDEIGELAATFNGMVQALGEARSRSEDQLRSLEAANAQLVATREQLVSSEKLASVGRLAAGVAHEVGNPLAAITGYVELLISDAPPGETRAILVRVRDEVGRIDGIVREMLDLARAPVGEMRPVDLRVLGPDVLDLLRLDARARGIEARCEVAADLPQVWGIEQKLRQVLLNLLFNAADALQGRGSLVLRVSAVELGAAPPEPDDGRFRFTPSPLPESGAFVVVEVEDNGPGIPRERLDHIFEPFFTTKEPGEGTGLGLSVALRLVEAQGGSFVVRSAPGRGTVASVWLPTHVEAP